MLGGITEVRAGEDLTLIGEELGTWRTFCSFRGVSCGLVMERADEEMNQRFFFESAFDKVSTPTREMEGRNGMRNAKVIETSGFPEIHVMYDK